ncbi:MAG: sortase [Anaerolineae bacterium]|nr:sortase [Anaerolineae bacterium]
MELPATLSLPDSSNRPDFVPTRLPDLDQMLEFIPTPTPGAEPRRPVYIEIPERGVDVEVVHIIPNEEGLLVPPDYTAGYWYDSAVLEEDGTVLIVGHNREYPALVFRGLVDVERGDAILLTDQYGDEYTYKVAEVEIVELGEAGAADRLMAYVEGDDSMRLTLMTCHPLDECSARFIVVAFPVE